MVAFNQEKALVADCEPLSPPSSSGQHAASVWQAGVGVSAQEAERVPADGGSLTQGPAIVHRLLLHTPALQECVYITHYTPSADLMC